MAIQREILAKSILVKSGIADYAVNCYVGCLHKCVYCYARYMCKFTGHTEPWGQFLDVKINAPDLLARELRRKKPATVFFSSACDAWQPAERRYELTRRCLKIAADAGFPVAALTKSVLLLRDLDIIAAARESSVKYTITTVDESVRRRLEPAASSSEDRLRALAAAREAGIKTSVFCGPLLPELTDTPANIEPLFRRLAGLDLDHIYVDKLNFRTGVYKSILMLLHRWRPDLVPRYRSLYLHPQEYEAYVAKLGETVRGTAWAVGLDCRIVSP